MALESLAVMHQRFFVIPKGPRHYLLHLVGLMAATTLTIIASMQAVGVILVISLLVAPALTASLLVKELHQMMILGSLLGAGVSVAGVYLSYYTNLPSGPMIVLVSSTLFVLVSLLSPSQGILTRPELVSQFAGMFRLLRVGRRQ